MVLRSTWVSFTVILLNAVIPATLRRFHPFDSRQDVTKRPGSHHLLCTKTAMMLKPKTEFYVHVTVHRNKFLCHKTK